MKKLLSVLVLASISVSFLAATPRANADIRFGSSYHSNWNHGYWSHGHHEGRNGWWFVIGDRWHPYERPYYWRPRTEVVYETVTPPPVFVQAPVPPPQVTVVQAAPPAPPAPSYYCKATGTYYPETTTCPGGWMTSINGAPPMN